MLALFGVGPFELMILLVIVLVPIVVLVAVRLGSSKQLPPPGSNYLRPCPNCQRAIPADMIYCGYCGTPLAQQPAPGQMPPSQPISPPQ